MVGPTQKLIPNHTIYSRSTCRNLLDTHFHTVYRYERPWVGHWDSKYSTFTSMNGPGTYLCFTKPYYVSSFTHKTT